MTLDNIDNKILVRTLEGSHRQREVARIGGNDMNETLEFKNPLGRPLKYTPKRLAEKFAEYVQWCKDHPFNIRNRTDYANGYAENNETRPRYISITGFQLFIGCTDSWWANLDDGVHGEEFLRVKAQIKKFCEQYQIEMASTGQMKENIISRILGLADKKQVSAGEGVTIIVKDNDQKEKLENMGSLGV